MVNFCGFLIVSGILRLIPDSHAVCACADRRSVRVIAQIPGRGIVEENDLSCRVIAEIVQRIAFRVQYALYLIIHGYRSTVEFDGGIVYEDIDFGRLYLQ